MNPDERWQKIEQLFLSALEQEGSKRLAFLEAECKGDQSLREEVESLLAQAERTEVFLETPALEVEGRTHPAMIGRYRILRIIGEGGMGIVYEAEQEEPRRIVAVKMIKLGLAAPGQLRRFRQESRALARLQHPGIAQIYESNTADTGFGSQPYFAMEFIRGLALNEYAEARHLDTRKRLALMVKVCEAVHHAHQRGLIHRDLKPANILVDELAQPKILDFGVARLVQRDSQETDAPQTTQTGLGQIVGTLAYMSPEQVLGDPLEVDTRSDVYALGVILYQLLCGRPPYEVNPRQLPEAVRTIRNEEPASLSTIDRNYRGDIETIAKKALEKDKTRRYASAADLGADIQRYLNDEPISARPPSGLYQLRKFARRNRGLMAAVAAVFLVLVAGISASTWEAIRANQASKAALAQRDRAAAAERTATEQRDREVQSQLAATAAEARAVAERNRAVAEEQRADEESASAKAISDFLQKDMLAQASLNTQTTPSKKPDPDLKVRTALDRAAATIEGRFARQPLVEASIRQTIGAAYQDLGLYPEAQRHLERALELRRRVLGEDHKATLDVMNAVALVYEVQGNYPRAEALFSKALESLRRVAGNQDPETLTLVDNLGGLYADEGKYTQAEPLIAQAVEARRHFSGESHPDTLTAMSNLGWIYNKEGKYGQAETILAKTVALQRRVSGDEHPETLTVMNNLGMAYDSEGKYDDAERIYSEVLAIRRRVLGEDHPNTLNSMHNLAVLYRREGKGSESEALFVKTVEIRRRVQGRDHPDTLAAMNNLAITYRTERKYPEAESLLRDVWEARSRALGNNHPYTLNTAEMLGLVQFQEQEYQEVENTLRAALNGYETAHLDIWQRFHCQSILGAALAMEKRFTEAEPLLLSGYQGMTRARGAMPAEYRSFLTDAREAIARLYEDWGKSAKAAEWRELQKEAPPGQ